MSKTASSRRRRMPDPACFASDSCSCSEHGSRLIEPRLLLLLRDQAACGYELRERIDEIPLGAVDTGALYRSLRRMEDDGLVRSKWDTGGVGPARRTYMITPDGRKRLAAWAVVLRERGAAIGEFVRVFARHQTGRKGAGNVRQVRMVNR